MLLLRQRHWLTQDSCIGLGTIWGWTTLVFLGNLAKLHTNHTNNVYKYDVSLLLQAPPGGLTSEIKRA